MLVSLTVGKVDAGVAVLLTEDKRLIEFPSILLPPDIASGSIVDVEVSRNFAAETKATKAFDRIQSQILSSFGSGSPAAPVLRCRNATQTSVVLEWDPIALATAKLRSLSLHRNGSKAGNIPRPLEMTSTKISGLAVDTEYNFNLVLRTSAGTYSSERLVVRTHKMTDLTGITVTPGIMPSELRESLETTVERMGAKIIEQVRIDTTHFVCTEGRGSAWEKATEMNVPIVTPDWVKGCEREGRLVGVRGYYLNADPKMRQMGPGAGLQRDNSTASLPTQQQSRRSIVPVNVPRTEVTPPTPDRPSRAPRKESRDINGESVRSPVVTTPPTQADREHAPSPKAKTIERPQTPPAQTAQEDKPVVPAKDSLNPAEEVAEVTPKTVPEDVPGSPTRASSVTLAAAEEDITDTALGNSGKVTAAVEEDDKDVVEEVRVDGAATDAETKVSGVHETDKKEEVSSGNATSPVTKDDTSEKDITAASGENFDDVAL